MKTTQITVERNFHILNEDRFIMEKISMTADVEDSDPDYVANMLREQIIQNFNAAYPHVHEYLNFNVVKQVRLPDEQVNYVQNTFKAASFIVPPEPPNHSSKELIAMQEQSEKINKGTIEEQIEACTEIEGENGLASFAIISSTNSRIQKAYDKKFKELQKQTA